METNTVLPKPKTPIRIKDIRLALLGFLITPLSMFIGYATMMVLFYLGNSGNLFDPKWFVKAMFFPLSPGDPFLRIFGILYFVAPIIAIVWRKHKKNWIAVILVGFAAGLILLHPLLLSSF